MGRKVVAEAAIEKKFEADIKARKISERGILVGHLTAARDHLFAVVPFPVDPDAQSSLGPSQEWALEHAKQVSPFVMHVASS